MTDMLETARSRRALLKSTFAVVGTGLVYGCAPRTQTAALAPPRPVPIAPRPTPVARPAAPRGVNPVLFERAKASLDRHTSRIARRDRFGLVDFTPGSSHARFHFIDLRDGDVRTLLVAHGSGSDPAHTGYLQRFSNVPDSEATSRGAYLTSDYYVGKHGRSQRLIGLDPINDMALSRAIVVHGAWYANADMIAKHGKLGRSQGCFAVGENELDNVFAHLGEGRMIYADKV
jgi:hypothetical protein